MPAKTKAAAQPRARLATDQVSSEILPNGEIRWTHTPPDLEMVKRIPWRPIWCAGYETDEKGEKHYHHIDCIPCHCPPGPQYQAYWATAREVALWGGRNSGKSEVGLPFLIRGNLNYDPQNMKPADSSYLNCPDYTFLVLRKNAKDLLNYFRRAARFFSLVGGIPTESPMGVKFPTGAYGIFDHMADGDAWEKYQGPEWTRMFIEEAPQLGSESNYLKLIAACRTSNPDMTAQIMLTGNPGGAGWPWFKARFIKPEGKRLASNTVYVEPYSGRTRVNIFSRVDDNPLALAKGSDKDLDMYKADDQNLYKQWRLGDPDAVAGAFFEMFRESRNPSEPENAVHAIAPIRLDKYWPRAIGCDWGYSHPSAVYWGCWHPKGQLHVYRELVASRVGAVELGAEIAKRSMEDLFSMPNPHLNLYLSHDAFARTNEAATEAEQIAQGINMRLGPGAAFVLSPDQEEELLEDDAAWKSVHRRQQERARKTHITLVNAGLKRRGNLNRIREYLRWWPIEQEGAEFNEEVSRRILLTEGALAYYEYKQKCERRNEEVLPKLQIHHDPERDLGCPKLIAAMQAAVEAENDTEQMEKQDGDDPVDALAYLVGNFPFSTAEAPREVAWAEQLSKLRASSPALDSSAVYMAARAFEDEWARKHSGSHTFRPPGRYGPARRAWEQRVQ